MSTLLELKRVADSIQDNPNETIVNLTGQPLTAEQIEVLKLGLRHGLPNHFEVMSVTENVWDQISRLNILKEGRHILDDQSNTCFVTDSICNELRSQALTQ